MKKIAVLTLVLGMTSSLLAQNNYIPGLTTPGPIGFGVPFQPVAQSHNLHVHGLDDYCVDINPNGNPPTESMYCYGITSRFTMTNTTTGVSLEDGMLFRMSDLNFSIDNQEDENIDLATGGVNLRLSGANNNAWLGNFIPTVGIEYAMLNIQTYDDGLCIRTKQSGHYGLKIQTLNIEDIAFQVIGANDADRNFVVQSNGYVFARKYTTTLNNIPDYVFKPAYNLMPLPELRTYIQVNQHLPNIPSAQEYEETGVDLGEMNRLLLEKVEELTLYTLQLEERLSKLEEEK